jgi:hypothetical protein
MIVGVAAIKENRLLDQALPNNSRKEIDVVLCAAGAQRDVM